MRKRYLFLATVGFLASSASCLAALDPDELDLSVGSLKKQATSDELLNAISNRNKHGVKNLVLKGQQAVDDAFVAELVDRGGADRLINADLSDTKITVGSLTTLLESGKAGMWRDVPQYSSRFGIPSSTLYLDIKGTEITKEQKKTLAGTIGTDAVLQYGNLQYGTITSGPLTISTATLSPGDASLRNIPSETGPQGSAPGTLTPSPIGVTGFAPTHQVPGAVKWLTFGRY